MRQRLPAASGVYDQFATGVLNQFADKGQGQARLRRSGSGASSGIGVEQQVDAMPG